MGLQGLPQNRLKAHGRKRALLAKGLTTSDPD
jgi:hypothetical protein